MDHAGFHKAQKQENQFKTGSEHTSLGQPLLSTKPRRHSMFSSGGTEKNKNKERKT